MSQFVLPRLMKVNRILFWILPILAVMVVGDIIRWGIAVRKPVEPLRPQMKEIRQTPVAIASLDLPATLFKPAQPQAGTVGSAPVAVKEAQWKLLGVSLAASKRAFLQEADGDKSVWVGEGEQIGASTVKEIREKSVILETEGKSYEIRM